MSSIPNDLKGLTNVNIPPSNLRVRPVVREHLIAALRETKDFQQMCNRRNEIHASVKTVFAEHGRSIADNTIKSTISSVITELRNELLAAQQTTNKRAK